MPCPLSGRLPRHYHATTLPISPGPGVAFPAGTPKAQLNPRKPLQLSSSHPLPPRHPVTPAFDHPLRRPPRPGRDEKLKQRRCPFIRPLVAAPSRPSPATTSTRTWTTHLPAMPSWDGLKKKMANGTGTRSTRSRISSPHPGPNGNGNSGALEPSKTAANEGGKTALDLWLEPKVQSRPSYEDHGLVRHGVLENMRSLDDLPRPVSALQKRREGAGGSQPVRKIILRTSNARPASSSPAPPPPVTPTTVAPPSRESSSRRGTRESTAQKQRQEKSQEKDEETQQPPQPQQKPPVHPVKDELPAAATVIPVATPDPSVAIASTENSVARHALPGGRVAADFEDIHEAKAGVHTAASTTRTPLPVPGLRRSLPRATSSSRRTSVADDESSRLQGSGYADRSIFAPEYPALAAPAPFTPVFNDNSILPLVQQQEHTRSSDRLNIDRIVEAAVDDALNHHRYPTAWALRTLYDEKSPDPLFLELIKSVFTQTAEPAALREFAGLLRAAKRAGKKENQAWYYYGSTLPFPGAKPSPWASKVTLDLALVRERPVTAAPAPASAPATASTTAPATALASLPVAPPEEKKQSQEPVETTPAPAVAEETAAPAPVPAPAPVVPFAEVAAVAAAAAPTPARAPPASIPLDPETPSRRKRRSRKHRRSGDAMDVDDAGFPATPGSRRRAASDSSGLSELEQSPSLPSPTPIARRDVFMLDAVVADAAAADDDSAPNALRPIQQHRPGVARQQAASADTSQPTSPKAPAASTRDSTTTATATASSGNSSSSSSMPGRVSSPALPNPPKGKTKAGRGRGRGRGRGGRGRGGTLRSTPATVHEPEPVAATPSSDSDVEDGATIEARRQDARALTATQTSRVESFIRPSPADEPSSGSGRRQSAKKAPSALALAGAETPASSARQRKTRNSAVGIAGPGSSRVTRSGKRPIDEVDGTASSPAASTFPGDVASGPNSRAATPSLKPAAKKQRRNGPRVKSSPVKKKGGTAAGLPRPNVSEGPSGSFFAGMDENDENCSACGGVGDLVCCEECPRSFHFDCVDLDVTADLPDEWLCRICTTRKNPPTPVGPRGGFTSLINQLDRVNNQSFKLPQDIQTYFEGVRAGPEGDYESFDPNAPVALPKPRRRGVVDDGPDFFPVRDAEDRAILCHNCQAPTSKDRAIIPCSVCGLHWHLDCVNPPLAIPPVVRTWVCPAHPGDLLENQPGGLGPAHRYRKIKGASVIDAEYSRGMRNNGFIEIYDDGPPEEDSGWRHMDTFGRVHRVPESGIVLDFIDNVHKAVGKRPIAESAEATPRQHSPAQAPATPAASVPETQPTTQQPVQHRFDARPIQEAQAALNLASLSGTNNAGGLDTLAELLLANADQSVLNLMARGSADSIASGNISTMDAQSLRAMKAQLEAMTQTINSRLRLASGSEPASTGTQRARARTSAGTNSPALSEGMTSEPIKNEGAEHDLPTPATIAADSGDMNTGMLGKSSPANDSAMDLD